MWLYIITHSVIQKVSNLASLSDTKFQTLHHSVIQINSKQSSHLSDKVVEMFAQLYLSSLIHGVYYLDIHLNHLKCVFSLLSTTPTLTIKGEFVWMCLKCHHRVHGNLLKAYQQV